MMPDPAVLGTIGQWAAPFITWGLSFLLQRRAEERQPRAEQIDDNIDAQLEDVVRLLGARRIYLLKRMELRGYPSSPENYAPDLAGFDGAPTPTVASDGWRVAARYACDYLSALNLVAYRGSDVVVSDLGRAFLASKIVRADFHDALTKASPLS